jgi:hypothetical protein
MAEVVGFPEAFAAALAEVAPVLDERARRLLLGAGARQLGWGGIKLIAAATGAAADTVGKGAAELEAGIVADGRVRAPGAGQETGRVSRSVIVAGAEQVGGSSRPVVTRCRGCGGRPSRR